MTHSKLQLYSYFRSTASYRVRVALELKEIPYEYKPIHLLKDGGEQHSSEFKQLNPMGELPCLVHNENSISQSMAIVTYLDEVFPQFPLFPQEPVKKAKVIQVCEIVNSGIHPIQNLKVLKELTTRFSLPPEGKISWAHDWIERGFYGLEETLRKTAGSFCFGGTITAADLFVAPQVFNARRFQVNMNQFPTIKRIEANCLELDAFKKAEPGNQPDTPKS